MISPVPCGIRNIDLRQPLQTLVAENNERSLLVFFWQDGIPVGRRFFLEENLPVPASAMPALAASSSALAISRTEASTEPSNSSDLKASDVSVIVCTRDRPEQLHRCISAIFECAPCPGEIIVVDNADAPGTLDTVLQEFREIKILHENRPGLSFARNTGVAAAAGKVIAFTDDDVVVTKNWVKIIAASFKDSSVGAVTGSVLPAQLQTEAELAFELDLGGLAPLLEPNSFDKDFLQSGMFDAPHVWEIGAGANLSIRKTVFEEIGPFDVRLGAGAAGCSEDSEFLYRLLNANWKCDYRPEIVVWHNHRDDEAGLRSQMRAYMRGHVAALLVQFSESRQIGNLSRVFIALPRYHLGGVIYRLTSWLGFKWFEPWGRTARKTRFAQFRGSIEGVFYYFRNRSKPKFSSSVTGVDK